MGGATWGAIWGWTGGPAGRDMVVGVGVVVCVCVVGECALPWRLNWVAANAV